jgi:hypothetical protein
MGVIHSSDLKCSFMKTQWQLYKELELIPDLPFKSRSRHTHLERIAGLPSPPAINVSPLKSWLSQLWQAFDIALLRDLESRIWHSVDPLGHTCWHIYDPESGKTFHLNSKQQMQRWLEELL